jgi:hypothetical protein
MTIQILDEVKRVLSSKAKGDKWVEAAIIPLVEVAVEIKDLEAKKSNECKEYRAAIKNVDEKYKQALSVLGEIDINLRERVMKEHEGTESVRVDGIGELVFAEIWGYEIVDLKKIDPKYLTVDGKLVKEDIKKGMRNIKGLNILPVRSLRVMTKRD